MLSMYKDSSGKTVVDVTGCETIREVKIVKMRNLGLTGFDQEMFTEMPNVEELDISGNRLEIIPDIHLPNLKRLDCSRNKFADVLFLKQFPKLEEIDLKDNSVAFSDYCIASVLCPAMKRINKQDLNVQSVNQKYEARLKPLINKVWIEHFQGSLRSHLTDEEFEALGEKFRLMLKHSTFPGTKLLEKFKDFKLSQLIDEYLSAIRDPSHMDLQPYTMTGRVRRNFNSKQTSSQLVTPTQAVVQPQVDKVVRVGDNGSVDATVLQSTTEQQKESENAEVIVTEVVEEVVTQVTDTGTVFEESGEESSTVILVAEEEKSYEVGPGVVILFTREDDTSDMSRMIYVTKEGFTDNEGNLIQEIVLENGNPLILPDHSKDETSEVVEVAASPNTNTQQAKIPDLKAAAAAEDDENSVVITVETSQDPAAALVTNLNPDTLSEALTEVEVETVSLPVQQVASPDHSQYSRRCDTSKSDNSDAAFTRLLSRSPLKENPTLDSRTSQSSKVTTPRPPSTNTSALKQNFTRKIRREIDKPVVQPKSDPIQPIRKGPQNTVTSRQPMSVRRESRLLAHASNAIPVLPKRTISQLAASNLNEQNQVNKVKFWLYDEEIKPLRKKPREPPPTGTKSKKRNLSKYIVGPASQFSLVNRMEAAAKIAAEGPQSENKNPQNSSGSVNNNVSTDPSITPASQRLDQNPANNSQQPPVTYTRKPVDRLPSQDAAARPAPAPPPTTTDLNQNNSSSQSSIPEVNVQHPVSKPQNETNGFSATQGDDGEPSVVKCPPKKRVRFLDEAKQQMMHQEAVKQHTPIIPNGEIGVN